TPRAAGARGWRAGAARGPPTRGARGRGSGTTRRGGGRSRPPAPRGAAADRGARRPPPRAPPRRSRPSLAQTSRARALLIPSEEMEDAVHEEPVHLRPDALAALRRLPPRRVHRDDDVPEQPGD